MSDLISRQQAIDALENTKTAISENGEQYIAKQNAIMRIDALPSAQPTFDARDTQYNLPIGTDCISRQAAIDALANTKDLVDVTWTDENDNVIDSIEEKRNIIANWLEKVPPAQPEIVRCKDCKYFELDHFEKVDWFPIPIIVAHEVCMKWGEGCKSSVDGWCFMAERRTDEE